MDRDGVDMMCKDKADAQAQVIENDDCWPQRAPHRAALLGDVAAERERCARLCLEKPGYFGSFANAELFAALIRDAAPEVPRHPHYPCRSDGRCQYAIDHGAEGLGHCPRGKCVMPDHGGLVA